jgi:hypothetical protein
VTAAAPCPGQSPPVHLVALAHAVTVWLALAGLGQLAYLAHWPMFLWGVSIPYGLAVPVALLRLGVYCGLARGMSARRPAAWAGALAELTRTFLVFVLIAILRRGELPSALYPAVWAQGLLSAALPAIVLLNAALSSGWSPGGVLFETQVFLLARALAGGAALCAMGLRRVPGLFGVPENRWQTTAVRDGIPVMLLLIGGELVAMQIALRVGGH